MILEDKQTCCFIHLVERFIEDNKNYLLPVKQYMNTVPNKVLLGYYDDEYIYLIPSVVIGMCDKLLIENNLAPFNMQNVLKQLFALNYIKVHWIMSKEVRYRPQKRIGSTKRRYITFHRRVFFKNGTERGVI